MSKAKVLYITSLGHSGSTLLDLLAGTLPDTFSMGEVHFLSWQLLQGAKPNDPQTYCSCGKEFKNCKVYGKVLNDINFEKKVDVFKTPQKYDFSLTRHIVRYKSKITKRIANKVLEISLKSVYLKPIALFIYIFYYRSIKRNWDLFDRVSKQTGKKYLIDSSKDFLRFWLLKMHRPEDIKLIILSRDLKGVASSSHGGLNQNIIDQRIKSWLEYHNVKIKPAQKYLNKSEYIYIKYEDICENAKNVRRIIANFIQVPVGDIEFENILSPYKYHTIQGNPMRLIKDDIEIKHDERWKKRLSKEQIKNINRAMKNLILKIN